MPTTPSPESSPQPADPSTVPSGTREEGISLEDQDAATDLERFLLRARTMADTGVRLQARGTVLAAWVSVLQPRGLGDRVPVALGLRTFRLPDDGAPGSPARVDGVHPIASVLERLARMRSMGMLRLTVPPVTENPAWAAVTPPRGGWEPIATVQDDELQQIAQDGVRELGQALPQDPGASMVAQARAAVWGRMLGGPTPDEGIIPAGAAFAVHGLGFLHPSGTTTVHAAGPWVRLSNPAGFVLCRPAPKL